MKFRFTINGDFQASDVHEAAKMLGEIIHRVQDEAHAYGTTVRSVDMFRFEHNESL